MFMRARSLQGILVSSLFYFVQEKLVRSTLYNYSVNCSDVNLIELSIILASEWKKINRGGGGGLASLWTFYGLFHTHSPTL